MKTYTVSFADVAMKQVQHPHPERTAYKIGGGLAGDYTFKVWPSRQALLTTIRMQEKRAPHFSDWKLLVK